MELYKWQKECLRTWEENGFHGIVNVVTGAGKTVFALAAVKKLLEQEPADGLRVRIIVPTVDLASQWKRALLRQEAHILRPGLYGGGRKDRIDAYTVMIYIINSARDVLASHIKTDMALGRRVLLICDECHHYQSPANSRIFGFLEEPAQQGSSMVQRMPASHEVSVSPKFPEVSDSPKIPVIFDSPKILEMSNSSRLPKVSDSPTEGATFSSNPFPVRYACLGLSATPFNTERDEFLIRVLGREIYSYSYDRAAQENVIAPFALCQVAVGFQGEEREAYAELTEQLRAQTVRLYEAYPIMKHLQGKEFMRMLTRLAREADMDPEDEAAACLLTMYRRREISLLAKQRSFCCRDLLDTLPQTERAIIFCERIAQAEELIRLLERSGYRCRLYHSKLPPDVCRDALRAFRDGQSRILISCKCLDEGLDVPDAGIGIVLSGSATARQRIQRLGRIIRKAEGKDTACLYYLYVKESNDDCTYISQLQSEAVFDLDYYAAEKCFANDIYEYAGIDLLRRAEAAGIQGTSLQELRQCINEGLTRADYLLPESTQKKNRDTACNTHKRNYWSAMLRIGRYFRKRGAGEED